ncbi:MAG TPA: Na+/H+ antiporter NhaA [Cytophagales bacterium]|jgi:Na+:H+ antiporter, NhaA family|nr:Na+/H+ antiporter NhaA [Cytophagales bacterium]
MKLTKLFTEFFDSEKTSGVILIACTLFSLIISNSTFAHAYQGFFHVVVFSKPIEFWINDGLMTIFFLLVGLEIEREIYIGELADIKKSMMPAVCAIGGMLVPALIYFSFNKNGFSQNGFGIPMATDIAFSLAVLSLLGNRVPVSLKIFLTALAIIDDLGAIVVIALFYSKNFHWIYLVLAASVFGLMLLLNRMKVYITWVYLTLGCVMWILMYRSGIHPTITGVLLAFAIPFGNGEKNSLSYVLQHRLHRPVAFIVLPLFALANTAITFPTSFANQLFQTTSLGIIFGLVLGKPLGIFSFALIGKALRLSSIPADVKLKQLFFTGLLAGIGFTMSIFITLLAFTDATMIDHSKIAIMMASVLAGSAGYLGLRLTSNY